MTRLYLCGPMTNVIDMNQPAFNAEAARLRALGYTVVNPAEVVLGPDATWLDYMRADLPLLLTCDGVAHLPGWQGSKGARIECDLARNLGLTVDAALDLTRPDPKPCRKPVDFSDMDEPTDWAAA